MKLAHARETAAAVLTWCAALMWLWPRAALADAALSAEFRLYDWWSLLYAACLGLLGGSLALIVALATDRRVVFEVFKESGRNAVVSPIAGAAAYLGLKALAAFGWLPVLSTEPRFLVIVGCGWAGIAFFGWVRAAAGQGAATLAAWLARKGQS